MDDSGKRLKTRRYNMGMTLDELSKKSGISKATLSRYENNGISKVPLDKLNKLSKLLNTTSEYLLSGKVEKSNKLNNLNYYDDFVKAIQIASETPNTNFKRFFSSTDDFFDGYDKLDKRNVEMDKIEDKLLNFNEETFNSIVNFVNYLYSDDSNIDINLKKFTTMLKEFNKETKSDK